MAILDTITIGNASIIVIDDEYPLENSSIGTIAVNSINGSIFCKKNNVSNGWSTITNTNSLDLLQHYIFSATQGENILYVQSVASGGTLTLNTFEEFAIQGSVTLTPIIGFLALAVTNNAASRAGSLSSLLFRLNSIHFKKIQMEATCRFVVSNPVLGTNVFKIRIGFMNSVSAQPTNGIYFESPNAGDTTWRIVARRAGVETSISTTYNTFSTSYINMIVLWSDDNVATFIIKDAVSEIILGTINTNIPLTTLSLGNGFSYIKTVGAVTGSINFDGIKTSVVTKNKITYD